MSDLSALIEELSPEKQDLLSNLLLDEGLDADWLAEEYLAPRDPEEKLLCAIFEQVLGIEPIGIRHDFFELGGDSIQSIHIAAKARNAGVKVTTRAIFEHPTIEELVEFVRTAAPEELEEEALEESSAPEPPDRA